MLTRQKKERAMSVPALDASTVIEPIRQLSDAGGAGVLCVITHVDGPSYRPLGAMMAVLEDGRRIGTLSSGCVEADIALHAAKALDMSADDVTVNQLYLGGAFGRRLESDYPVQAARVAKEAGYPIKMIWSREEDTRQDFYRPADTSRFSAGLDGKGSPVSWNNAFTQLNGPDGSWDVAHYDIPNRSIRHAEADMHLRFGSLRAVDHSQQGFFVESFIDELAHAAGQDPFDYRRKLLGKSPRHKAVLEKVAKMA